MNMMLVRTVVVMILSHFAKVHINVESTPMFYQSARTLSSSSTYYIFTIRPFELIFTLKNEEEQDIPSLVAIANNITVVTSDFLTECMNKNLALIGLSEDALEKLQMNVNVYKQREKEMQFKGIIEGHAKFRNIIIPPLLLNSTHSDDYKINQKDIQKIVRNDCLGYNSSQYLKHIKDNLPMIFSADINIETEAFENGLFLGEQDIEKNSTDDNSGDTIVILLLSLSLLVLVGGLYIYFSHDYHLKRKCSEEDHILLSDVEAYSDECDHNRSQRLESEALGEEDAFSDSLIPVPVPDDAICLGISKSKKDRVKAIAPRRYVQTASPFDVLYGAAFLHHDQERVEQAHRQKSTKKSLHSRRRSTTKSKPLQTMVVISEEKEYVKPSSSPNSMSLFPQFMSTFSKIMSPQDGQDNRQEKGQSEEMIVYRDFPRHDGTPCVMYTPKDEIDWNYAPQTSKASPLPYENGDMDDSFSQSSLSQSSSMGSSMVAGIDNFVDKLERLIAARSRQYQERVKMDKESEERRKAHENNRRTKEKIHHLDEDETNKIIIDTNAIVPCKDGEKETLRVKIDNESVERRKVHKDYQQKEEIIHHQDEEETNPIIVDTEISVSSKDGEIDSGDVPHSALNSAIKSPTATPNRKRVPMSEISLNLPMMNPLSSKARPQVIKKYQGRDTMGNIENTNKINTEAGQSDSTSKFKPKPTEIISEEQRESSAVTHVVEMYSSTSPVERAFGDKIIQ